MKHDIIKTGDADSFAAIEDRNGEVALTCCRVCGEGEGTLARVCPGPRTLTPPADAPLPWTVEVDGAGRPRIMDATGEPMLVDADRARYLVAAANAAPELVERVRRLEGDQDAHRRIAEDAVAGFGQAVTERDTALARVAEIEAQNSRLRSTLEGIAERDCEYYDNCPSNARHYVCDVCRASRALETP